MDGSGQARRRGPVFVGKTFPRVVGSCSSGILTPCSCAVRWVRQVRDWTPLLSHFWTFTVEHSGALGSKNPVESNWYSLVSPARILEWKNHLCGLNHGSNHDSEELLNCYTWRERIKVGVRKIHFYCASSTADGGSWEQETAVPDTSDLGQRPSALCCSRGGVVALLCLWQLGRTWPVAYSGCQIIPKRWHLVSVLGGTRLLFARTSLHLWELPFCCNKLRVSPGCFSAGCACCWWLLTSFVGWFDMSDWNPSELNGSLLEASCYFLW